MKVIYIASKYRDENAWQVEQNIRYAERLAYAVAELGVRLGERHNTEPVCVPLCPHSMTRFFDGTLNGQYWIDATLELMHRCDAVLVGNQEGSEGTLGEIEDAMKSDMPVFGGLWQLEQWMVSER